MTIREISSVSDSKWADKLRILLVDDEPKNLTALESLLEANDRELVRATSGFEALKQLLAGDFALIILDVQMPGMDGFETAELIRARDRSQSTPIIFLTAAVRGDFAVSRGYGLGAVDYIVKPVDPDILRAKVAVFADLFRKTAEAERHAQALAEAHAFLNGVLDGATETTIAALDIDGHLLVWNEGGRRMYGHPASSIVGQHVRTLFAEEQDGSEVIEALFARTNRDGMAREDARHVRANGRTFPARVTLTYRRQPNGKHAGYVLITSDLTEQQQAETAQLLLIEERASHATAEREHQRLQQLLDVLPEPVLVTDAQGQVERLNAAARSLVGDLPAGTNLLRGRRFGFWERLQPDGSAFPTDRVPLARALLAHEPVYQEQMLLRNPETGDEVHVLANVAPVLEATGGVIAGVMALHDISALKALERQKDEFLTAISHDLRNPLTIIAGEAQLLSRRASRLGSEEATFFTNFLHSIDSTAKRAAGMVNELLDVARMQMNRPLRLDCEPVDLVAVATNVATDLQTTTDRHAIVMKVEGAPITGEWDRARLERVAVNLIENAIKYSPDGGEIVVRVWQQEGAEGPSRAFVSIADRGVGIAADEIPRVFDRFYRARNVIGKVEGSGIGLAAAKRVVEAHGGEIAIESEECVGTTVTICLPVEPTLVPSTLAGAWPSMPGQA